MEKKPIKKIKKKIKPQKDYSALLNTLIVIVFLVLGVFLYISGAKNNQQTNIKPEKKAPQVQTTQQEKPVIVQQVKQQKKPITNFQKFKYTYTYTVNIQGNVKRLELEVPIPINETEKQYLSNVSASLKPTKLVKDGINTVAHYTLDNLTTRTFNIVFSGEAKVRTYNIEVAKMLNKNLTPESDLTRYLKPEPLIESNDPYIKSIANKIKGNSQEEIIYNIYKYIQDNVEYTMMPNIGAKRALQQRKGKCTEHAAIMIALCRAKKIPARMVIGNIAREQFTQHNWVEVYYDKYGWVTYDPTVEPSNIRIVHNGKLVRVEKKYNVVPPLSYITAGRNLISTYTNSYSVSDTRGGNAKITENIKIEKIQ